MSSYIDATARSVEHCEAMSVQFPDLAEPYYNKIAMYCQEKLWHQLTTLVLDFVSEENKARTLKPLNNNSNNNSSNNSNNNDINVTNSNTFLAMYENVILVIHKKINPLSLARIASAVAFCCFDQALPVDQAKALLQDLLTQQEASGATATKTSSSSSQVATVLYLQSKLGLLTLQTMMTTTTPPAAAAAGTTSTLPPKEQLDPLYRTIKTNGLLLAQLTPDTPEAMAVNEAHYEFSMTYFKLVGPPEAFYEEAMHYLNYYQPKQHHDDDDDMKEPITTTTKSHRLAVDLCLAALTGEGVYNLGQLVTNPFLQLLLATPDAWLVELLQACADGNVSLFKHLCQSKYTTQIASQPALINFGAQMQEKITLLGLVELVFAKPASDRTLEFTEIAHGLEIPLEQVEYVIMRAFSVQLMRGQMDQVHGTVHVTWILPRALQKEQMAGLATRFGEWADKVNKIKEYMQQQTHRP